MGNPAAPIIYITARWANLCEPMACAAWQLSFEEVDRTAQILRPQAACPPVLLCTTMDGSFATEMLGGSQALDIGVRADTAQDAASFMLSKVVTRHFQNRWGFTASSHSICTTGHAGRGEVCSDVSLVRRSEDPALIAISSRIFEEIL